MSDQGEPGQGRPGYGAPESGQPYYPPPPAYQPPAYQPSPGYQPPPAYAPPPDYAPPPPQYGPPYGDPQYPTGQYPTEQYPTGQYPTGQYPAVPYPGGGQPPPYPGAVQHGAGGSGRKGALLALAVALLAALGLAGYFVFTGGSASAATPQSAVRKLLDAGKTGDTAAAKRALCSRDANDAVVAALRSSGRIVSYAIQSTTMTNSTHAIVRTRLSTSVDPVPTVADLPVVKEGGSWKVCPLPSAVAGGPGAVASAPQGVPSIAIPSISIPIPSISIPNVSVPSGVPNITGINPCGLSAGLEQAAIVYVGLAELGQTDYAQQCVWHGVVPRSVTAGLRAADTGGYFSPSGSSGATVSFTNLDGSRRLTVTMAKEADGQYYVTKVHTG